MSKTAALTLNTFRDVLGSGGGGKLAFEIDMSGEPQSSSPLSAISETASSGAVQDYASGEMVSVSQILNASGEKSAALGGSNGESSSASSLGAGFGSDSAPSDATAKTSSGKSAKNSSAPATSLCGFASAGSPARKVIFNEIAWMGSAPQAGETAAHAANREWIELKNISRDDIDLTGWQISDSSGKFKVIFGAGDKIGTGGSVTFNAGGFYLLERASDNSVPGIKANEIYSGVLTNSGMSLRLFGADCTLSDEIVNASSGWAAGDNPTKATMERNAHDFGWHTSVSPGGTPKAENSVPAVVASATTTASTSTITAATTTAVTVTTTTVSAATTTPISSIVSYTVGVSSQGDGSGMVISSPVGIYCGTDCVESYISGTLLTLAAMPDSNSEFAGWSGPCSGTGVCVFAVNGTTAVVGMFKSLAPSSPTASQSSGDDQSGENPTSTPAVPASGGIVVSEIFYDAVGSDAGKEFVELYNGGTAAVDLPGWSLKNGTSSLVSIGSKTEDKTSVNGGGYFLIGFSSYNSTPPADAVRSASLPNTTTTLTFYNKDGGIVDSVTYPASCSGCLLSAGQSYERDPLSGDQFVVEPNPNPQNSGNL